MEKQEVENPILQLEYVAMMCTISPMESGGMDIEDRSRSSSMTSTDGCRMTKYSASETDTPTKWKSKEDLWSLQVNDLSLPVTPLLKSGGKKTGMTKKKSNHSDDESISTKTSKL